VPARIRARAVWRCRAYARVRVSLTVLLYHTYSTCTVPYYTVRGLKLHRDTAPALHFYRPSVAFDFLTVE
jgi:hypothetical protein